jgi:hypothetical protein
LLLLIDQSHAYLGAVAATTEPEAQGTRRFLSASLMFIALVVAVAGSPGAPLIAMIIRAAEPEYFPYQEISLTVCFAGPVSTGTTQVAKRGHDEQPVRRTRPR